MGWALPPRTQAATPTGQTDSGGGGQGARFETEAVTGALDLFDDYVALSSRLSHQVPNVLVLLLLGRFPRPTAS